MDEASAKGRRQWLSPSAGITLILVASAGIFLGFRLTLALGREDMDKYESPLMLSVARQLIVGPWELYGPFGGSNPLVLIHGPLYYRVAGLLAWPMASSGLHPADAARLAGRVISAVGLAATMVAVYRLGGQPRRARLWSALLVGSSPVLAGQPFAVRPDMAGVALQLWGVVLVLQVLAGWSDGSRRRLTWASVLFGLAVCVKQHLVGAWAVSVALAMSDWRRGRLGSGAVQRIVMPGLAVAVVVYGAEWLVTSGRVWDAAFVAASHVGRVHAGDWLHVGTVIAAMLGKGAGLAALAAAGVAAGSDWFPAWLRVAAGLLVLSIAALAVAQLAFPAPWITLLLPLFALAGLTIAIPGWVTPARSLAAEGRVDATLAMYCAGEVILLVSLCRSSSGAWINYGIPTMIFAAVLTARSLACAANAISRARRAIVAVAGVAIFASILMDAKVEVSGRRAEHADLARVFASTRLPPHAIFFADHPGLNRMSGRLEWVYDDWLYPAFESLKLAEPRARWLRPVIGPRGAARAVVLDSDRLQVDGIPESLPTLGFVRAGRFGSFRVWTSESSPPRAP
jgi:hypothetical protein